MLLNFAKSYGLQKLSLKIAGIRNNHSTVFKSEKLKFNFSLFLYSYKQQIIFINDQNTEALSDFYNKRIFKKRIVFNDISYRILIYFLQSILICCTLFFPIFFTHNINYNFKKLLPF